MEKIHDVKICRPCSMPQEIVLVDGPSRSGKTVTSRMLATMERVESERVEEIFDYVGVLYGFGKIQRDAAATLLRLEADIFCYHACLARNSNFRWKDSTSIFRYPDWKKYLRRLFDQDGDACVAKIKKEIPIFQVGTHHQMEHMDLHFDAYGEKLHVIELMRNPIDTIDAWMNRGHGQRMCSTARDFSICLEHKDAAVYYLGAGWEEEYLKASPVDRVIRMLYVLNEKIRKGYEKLSSEIQSRILLLRFEELVVNPLGISEKMADFLGTRTTRYTNKEVKKMRLPWDVSEEGRADRWEKIKAIANKECLKYLDEMIAGYEREW